jgi:hypothetical protein
MPKHARIWTGASPWSRPSLSVVGRRERLLAAVGEQRFTSLSGKALSDLRTGSITDRDRPFAFCFSLDMSTYSKDGG